MGAFIWTMAIVVFTITVGLFRSHIRDLIYDHPKIAEAIGISAIVFVLFSVAFGFDTDYAIAKWLVTHPHEIWIGVRVIAGFVLLFCVPDIYDELSWRCHRKVRARSHVEILAPTSHAIEDFREKSPFGDANLAAKAEIAHALKIRSDGPTPKFEN